MKRLPMFAASLLIGIASTARAEQPVTGPASSSRYSLRQVRVEAVTDSDTGRFSVRARVAPAESPGELHESANFSLLGRFSKAGVGCATGGSTIFRNGFEGS
jgi:hypothetical protein